MLTIVDSLFSLYRLARLPSLRPPHASRDISDFPLNSTPNQLTSKNAFQTATKLPFACPSPETKKKTRELLAVDIPRIVDPCSSRARALLCYSESWSSRLKQHPGARTRGGLLGSNNEEDSIARPPTHPQNVACFQPATAKNYGHLPRQGRAPSSPRKGTFLAKKGHLPRQGRAVVYSPTSTKDTKEL